MKKKLIVFTLYDKKGASSEYRAFIFKEQLDKTFNTKWYHFWNNEYATKYLHDKKKYIVQIGIQYITSSIKRWYEFMFMAPKADVIFLQKATIPKCKKLFLHRAKKAGTKIVFDVDDPIYIYSKDNSKYIAKISDVVICGNKTLENYYRKYTRHTVILPTVENTNNYRQYWHDTFEKKVIVWIGSKTTIYNLNIIVTPLNKVIERHPEVEFHIISNDDQGFTKRIKNSKLILWGQDTYYKDLAEGTIGIMPLYDTEKERGKCGFKLIQYLNMKKPVIGSGVGVNTDIIRGNGIIANTEDEWEKAFEKLLYEKTFYKLCIKHIEDNFFDEYGFNNICKRLIEILKA